MPGVGTSDRSRFLARSFVIHLDTGRRRDEGRSGALLGGLLGGGAAGGILSGGLGDLLKQFQQNGQGDKAQSWISSGPNKAVSPRELEEALGPDKIAWLMQQTGQRRGSSSVLAGTRSDS